MADPATARMGIGMATSVAGGLLGAKARREEAEATAKMHEYRAGIARLNAAMNRQNSNWTLDAGEHSAKRTGITGGFTIAKQRVAQGASGFSVEGTSATAVREAQHDVNLEDQTAIRTTSGRKALDFRNRAVANDMEAAMEMQAAANARKAGKVSLASTLLGTAGGVASKWTQASRSAGAADTGITSYDENFLPVAYTPT